MKLKTCKVCRSKFSPLRPLQSVCSPDCSLALVVRHREKSERLEAQQTRRTIKAQKEKLKTKRDYIKEAQRAFNEFIRERDKGKPCICCGKPLGGIQGSTGGIFDAGHYRSVGSAPHLRFDERNCHGQRKQCNQYGSGRAVDYRIGLIQRIGRQEVESLESDNQPKKYSIEELKEIKTRYKLKLKELRDGYCRPER